MKRITKLIVLALLMITILPTNIFAEEEIIDLKTDYKKVNDEWCFTLSDDYAALSPEFTLTCDIEKPEVIDPNGEVVGSMFTDALISFLADVGGTYVIKKTQSTYLNLEATVVSNDVLSAKDNLNQPVNLTGKEIDIVSEPVSITENDLDDFGLNSSEGVIMLDIYLTTDSGSTVLNNVVLKNTVEITIDASYEHKPHTENNNSWVYDVLRIHDGTLEVIAKNLVANNEGKIKFSTDRFSKYAVVAKERHKAAAPTPGSNSSDSSSSSSSSYKAPNTSVR